MQRYYIENTDLMIIFKVIVVTLFSEVRVRLVTLGVKVYYKNKHKHTILHVHCLVFKKGIVLMVCLYHIE